MPTNALQAYEELKPFVEQLIGAAASAPMNDDERFKLAMVITSRFYGFGCAALERFTEEHRGQPIHVISPHLYEILQKTIMKGLN